MKKTKLHKRLYFLFIIFCVTIFICVIIFQTQATRDLFSINKNYIEQVSDRIIDNMELVFSNIEHVALSLRINADVKDFVTETDEIKYHEKAEKVSDFLESIYQPNGVISDILIYDTNYNYLRFLGDLGNSTAKRVGFLLDESENHILLDISEIKYTGYVSGIYEGEDKIGSIVFLMKDKVLNETLSHYDSTGYLKVAMVADEKIVASSEPTLLGKSTDMISDDLSIFTSSTIGFTPFEVLVGTDYGEQFASYASFGFIAVLTAFVLIVIILFFYKTINQLFFKPMLQIVTNADEIGKDNKKFNLEYTGEEEFDRLVDQINAMLNRLEDNKNELLYIQNEINHAKIEQQRAIKVSLKKQINAHFTVNTLNCIKRLSEKNQQEKASKMCNNLSYLLRYTNDAEEYICGLDEMFILEKYSDIMQIRYPNRFEVEFLVDNQMDDIFVPRMLVQPILENALTHGLKENKVKSKVTISANVLEEEEVVRLCIEDNGAGMNERELSLVLSNIEHALDFPWDEQGIEHISLPNIQKRVQLSFGSDYGLDIKSEARLGTKVTLTIPIINNVY